MNSNNHKASFQIEFLQYWHAGTGQAGTGDLDAVILRDSKGFPFLPGKSIKGLFSEALCELAAAANSPTPDDLAFLLGQGGAKSLTMGARLRFSDAQLPAVERKLLENSQSIEGLVGVIASTALEDGIAKARSLRRIEVAIPMALEFEIEMCAVPSGTAISWEQVKTWLGQAAQKIHMAGAHRHAGLGECRVVHCQDLPANAAPHLLGEQLPELGEPLVRIPFEVDLIDRVVLGCNSATAGPHECLDYVPGAAILGAAAKDLFSEFSKQGSEASFLVFHGGSVRFGDAHPAGPDGSATYPVPLSFHHAKGSSAICKNSGHLVRSRVESLSNQKWTLTEKQPKQLRHLWLSDSGACIKPAKGQTLKSARDTANFGRPMESMMFSYEYLEKGQTFTGEIRIRRDLLPAELREAIVKTIADWISSAPVVTLGRSRSAEFGRARIKPGRSRQEFATKADGQGRLVLFALSDIALDGGLLSDAASLHPSLAGWSLDPTASFTRFHTSSGWYGFLGCRLPERHLLSRGSVLVFKSTSATAPENLQELIDLEGVGLDIHRGRGRMLVNPAFLVDVPGLAEPAELNNVPNGCSAVTVPKDATLVRVAVSRSLESRVSLEADGLAETLFHQWKGYHPSPSPTQWSRMRELAARHREAAGFDRELSSMLDHGAAKRAWEGAKKKDACLAGLLKEMVKTSEDQKEPTLGPASVFISSLGRSSSERILLAAIAEACRRLRENCKAAKQK